LQEGVPEKRGKNHGSVAKIRVSFLSIKTPQPPVHQRRKAPDAGFFIKREIRADPLYRFLFDRFLRNEASA
jgi:hypothetical protein